MGFAVRSTTFRYIEWRAWNGTAVAADWVAPPLASGLYDHRNDSAVCGDAYFDFPGDYVNVAADGTLAAQLEELAAALAAHFADGSPLA